MCAHNSREDVSSPVRTTLHLQFHPVPAHRSGPLELCFNLTKDWRHLINIHSLLGASGILRSYILFMPELTHCRHLVADSSRAAPEMDTSAVAVRIAWCPDSNEALNVHFTLSFERVYRVRCWLGELLNRNLSLFAFCEGVKSPYGNWAFVHAIYER